MDKYLKPVTRRKVVEEAELGVASKLISSKSIVDAMKIVKSGQVYDLGIERFHGMPLPAMHPPLEILTYRSIQGMENQQDQEWITGETNESGFGFTSELVISCLHTGTHVDTLAHPNIGKDHTWYGGYSANKEVGNYGVLKSDASTLPPFIARGVLIDVPRYLGVEALSKREGISRQTIEEALQHQQIQIQEGDVVLVRTGYMSYWPNKEKLQEHAGSGLMLDAAQYICSKNVLAVGTDTEAVEQFPGSDPKNPHPVHTHILIENGVFMIECLDLEALAKDTVYEFLFIALPTKFRGGTAGLVDPIAVI